MQFTNIKLPLTARGESIKVAKASNLGLSAPRSKPLTTEHLCSHPPNRPVTHHASLVYKH